MSILDLELDSKMSQGYKDSFIEIKQILSTDSNTKQDYF